MKSRLISVVLFGLICAFSAFIIACDTKESDQEEIKTSESGRAKDGEDGVFATLNVSAQNGQHGQKGKNGQDGGHGGKGGNSWWGRGGDGGNGGDAD